MEFTNVLAKPLYAIKVIEGRRTPYARKNVTSMLTSRRYHVAKPPLFLGRKKNYEGPKLCFAGWHAFPLDLGGGPVASFVTMNTWNPLYRLDSPSWQHIQVGMPDPHTWLVALRGRYVADEEKIAADEIRFVREIPLRDQYQLHRGAHQVMIRHVLKLRKGDMLLHSLRGGFLDISSGYPNFTKEGDQWINER